MSTPALRIDAVGPQVTIQDLGRRGHADLGVTEGGAADRTSLRRANRLVGNAEDAAALEILIGGLEVTALADVTVTVAGAPCRLSHDDEPKETESPLRLRRGDCLRIGPAPVGLRSYLAVAGGVDAPVLLGSRSSSPSMGVGPAPLRVGDVVAVGATPRRAADEPGFGSWRTGALTVEVVPGPRDDLFSPESVDTLFAATWTLTSDLDRVGVRLDGPALRQTDPSATLASEAVVRGSLQVPPSGRPTVFLADHPVTGGYPVIGVVRDADTDAIAQLRPGDELRFRRATAPWA